jgi:hypothetical protein
MNSLHGAVPRAASAAREHLPGYQARDYEIVDYGLQQLPGLPLWFRGPLPPTLDRGDYFSCLGAAQTFGCFCREPYPTLLGQELGLPALNLGYGGAGPEFFARYPEVIDYVNRGRFLILQVMSGRSQSNSVFESRGLELLRRRSDGRSLGAMQAYAELLAGPAALRTLPPRRLGRWLARRVAAPGCRRLAAETRAAWIDSHRCLLAQVRVPVILFWFSKREPDYSTRTGSIRGYFGEYPQLIDRATLAAVQQLVPRYVECVTARGSPQPLRSRFTGRPTTVDPARDRPDLAGGAPWTHNHYYPSPEMHQDAAAALLAAARPLAQRPAATA